MTDTQLVKDLLTVPDQIRKGDFVVRLTTGVRTPDAIVGSFVATEGLVQAFDEALKVVGSALSSGRSQAAYLHGSFGSGKSHFMAVLSLLLDGNEVAWRKKELHPLRARHEFVGPAKLMRLHFHMIGKKGIESAVFAQYVDYVREHHPQAPLPAVFADEQLFEDARKLLETTGEDAFFAALNRAGATVEEGDEQDDEDDDDFGDYDEEHAWTAARFEAAVVTADTKERAALVSALVGSFFGAFANSGEYIDLDRGLAEIANHAAGLGYSAVVLFLDELILWLAHKAGESGWLHNEVQKMVKLVEAQDAGRKIPIVSFIARQRNLADMVGEELAGDENARLNDSIKHWEDRFDEIVLEDDNLPAVIEQRVIQPRDDAARAQLASAFARLKNKAGSSWDTMLGESDGQAFAQVYPFSPALVTTLVALSNVLRRSRTAIRLLNELLVEHIDDLQLGEVVRVGDLFDPLTGGEDPADGLTKSRFLDAKRFYRHELLPIIQEQHGTNTAERCQRLRLAHKLGVGCAGCGEKPCRNDNRLAKTLLLAELVPNAAPLKNLTISRLVQLNYGSLKSIIPGNEASLADSRLREWSAQLPQVRVENQSVRVHLDVMALGPIIDQARDHDSAGARQRRLRELLFEELGVDSANDLGKDERVEYRKTRRLGHIRFGNVRRLGPEQLACDPSHDFRLVIDYPFDDEGHGPNDDVEVIERALDEGLGSWTLVWLPSFFSKAINDLLGDLVAIDSILESHETRRRYLGNLGVEDRARAESALESVQHQKKARIRAAMEQAYGLRTDKPGDLDSARLVDKHLYVLKPGVDIPIGAAPAFSEAKVRLVQELLERRYPRHPVLQESLTPKRIETLIESFQQLVDAPDHRITKDRATLDLLAGTLGELGLLRRVEGAVLLVTDRTLQDIERAQHQANVETPQVGQVRRWIDPNQKMGLLPDAQDLVVRCYAYYARRTLMLGGRRYEPGKPPMPDAVELEKPDMPAEHVWDEARSRTATLFGEVLQNRALHPDNLKRWQERLQKKLEELHGPSRALPERLTRRLSERRVDASDRLVTAQSARALCDALTDTSASRQAETLAAADLATSASAMARHFPTAKATCEVLDDNLLFGVFDQLDRLDGPRRDEAQELLEQVAGCLRQDELHVPAASTLRSLAERGQLLLKGSELPPPPPPPGETLLARKSVSAKGLADALSALERVAAELREVLERGHDVRLTGTLEVRGREKPE